MLDRWDHHNKAFEEINSYLMEARYSLSRFRLLTGSLEAVQVQVDNLQVRNECNTALRSFAFGNSGKFAAGSILLECVLYIAYIYWFANLFNLLLLLLYDTVP